MRIKAYTMFQAGAIGGVPGPNNGLWQGGITVYIDLDTMQVVTTSYIGGRYGGTIVGDRVGVTYVVAALSASTQARTSADFLCSGTNDQVQIQAALSALPAAGGCI